MAGGLVLLQSKKGKGESIDSPYNTTNGCKFTFEAEHPIMNKWQKHTSIYRKVKEEELKD